MLELDWSSQCYTVKSAYKEPAYREPPCYNELFFIPQSIPMNYSLLYVYKELWLYGTYFQGHDTFLISRFYCTLLIVKTWLDSVHVVLD